VASRIEENTATFFFKPHGLKFSNTHIFTREADEDFLGDNL